MGAPRLGGDNAPRVAQDGGVTLGTVASASITQPDYWWYVARSELLRVAVGGHVGAVTRALDVGSADGPSVAWLPDHVSLDVNPAGLVCGDVCGSALALPFADAVFDLVTAFDVLEHVPEPECLTEAHRTLAPGGRLLVSVPAYEWAWTGFDDAAGHLRRYTRRRLRTALTTAGFDVLRCTHIFSAMFPLFAAERLARKVSPDPDPLTLPVMGDTTERTLRALCRWDERALLRGDLTFGSSVVAAAVKQPG